VAIYDGEEKYCLHVMQDLKPEEGSQGIKGGVKKGQQSWNVYNTKDHLCNSLDQQYSPTLCLCTEVECRLKIASP
jgi:hypothetical protein